MLLKHGARLDYRESGGDDDTVLEKVLESGDEVLAERLGLERVMETHQQCKTLLANQPDLDDFRYFCPEDMPSDITKTLNFKQTQALALLEEGLHHGTRLICLPPRTFEGFRDKAKLIPLIISQLKQFQHVLLVTNRQDLHQQWERAFENYSEKYGKRILTKFNTSQLSLDIPMMSHPETIRVTLTAMQDAGEFIYNPNNQQLRHDLLVIDEQHRDTFHDQMELIFYLEPRLTLIL